MGPRILIGDSKAKIRQGDYDWTEKDRIISFRLWPIGGITLYASTGNGFFEETDTLEARAGMVLHLQRKRVNGGLYSRPRGN